jgi:hypothetical protein
VVFWWCYGGVLVVFGWRFGGAIVTPKTMSGFTLAKIDVAQRIAVIAPAAPAG